MKVRKHRYWTKKEIEKVASRFNRRVDFYRKGSHAYQAAYNAGILEEVCAHMLPSRKKNKFVLPYPNHSAVLGPAFTHTNATQFREKHPQAYEVGIRWGINWQEFYENIENASYIKRLITTLAENAAVGKLQFKRNLRGDIHNGATDIRLNLEEKENG